MLKINKNTSTTLSVIATVIVLLVLVFCTFAMPWILRSYLELRHPHMIGVHETAILVITYTAILLAYPAVTVLLLLLQKVKCGEVFTEKAVTHLRFLSWCCIAEALIFLCLSKFFPLALALVFAALFMGLILRVVKNVIEEATAIKAENDFTV